MKFLTNRYAEVPPQCVIAVIGVLLLPACKMTSLNSPVFFNYSTYTDVSSMTISTPLAHPQRAWQRGGDWGKEDQEIDSTKTSADYFSEDYNLEEDQLLANESCWMGISCDEFSLLAPPPDVIALIPPPPLPLFLFELEILHERENDFDDWELQAKKFNFRSYYVLEKKDNDADDAIVFRINPQWLSIDHIHGCSLCDWAKNTSAQPLFTKRTPSKVAVNKVNKWNEALIGVALISAIIGASMTCILIKLKKLKRLKILQKENDCKSSEVLQTENIPPPQTDQTANNNNCSRENNRPEKDWTLNRAKAETPQRHSSPSLNTEMDNPDSEELYINASALSVIYSDLTPNSDQTACEDPTSFSSAPTTFSDISNPSRHTCSPLCRKTLMEMYDNRGHVLPESPSFHSNPGCSGSSPSGSSSTPSSAYYSDVSVCEVQPSRRKKKKRKTDLERVNRLVNSVSETSNPSSVQSVPNCVQSTPNSVQFVPTCVQSLRNSTQSMPNCVQPIPNCVQSIPNSAQPMPNSAQSIPNCAQPIPNCIHSIPNCVQFIPSFMMVKSSNTSNNNFVQAHCISNFESTPVIINHCDNNSGFSSSKNNIVLPPNRNIIIKSPVNECIGKPFYYHVSDHCMRSVCNQGNEIYFGAMKDENSFIPAPCQQQVNNDIQKFDYEIYKGYSSSEVPSEYI